MNELGAYLRGLRRGRRLTLGQWSLRAGVNKATLSRWEAGAHWPRVPELGRAMDALGASASERAAALGLLDAPRALVALRQADDAVTMRLSLGDVLYGLRRRAGRSQADVARAAGVSRSLVCQWENDAARPDTGQLHAVGFALGASADEVGLLTARAFARVPLERSREALRERYRSTTYWSPGVTQASYTLHLLTLLAGFGRLARAGQADLGDVALIVSSFGVAAQMWAPDPARQHVLHRRALALAAQAAGPIHFHLASSVRSLVSAEADPRPLAARVAAALAWQPRFPSRAGQAFLLKFVADALAEEAPDEALRLGERYRALVAGDPDESTCREYDFGSLLRRCGRAAESVAFLAALEPPDTYRQGLKSLEMARGLISLGSTAEAGRCLSDAKAILPGIGSPFLQTMIRDVERALG